MHIGQEGTNTEVIFLQINTEEFGNVLQFGEPK